VIDSLCDQAGGQDVAVACFYFDFAAQKEQSSTSMLGALLRQVVVGLEEIPGEIQQAYEEQKKFIGGRRLQHTDIVKMLQNTSSKKLTFICIDALDECMPEHRVKLLGSLNRILQKSLSARVFVTGRPHIRPEIERCLYGRVKSLSISPKRDDVVSYLRTRLGEDTTLDAMNSGLEAEILEKIPEEISEMYVEITKLVKLSTDRYAPSFLLVSLSIGAILQETTIHRRRQKLRAMTDGLGLGDAYGATLGRIKGQGGEKARVGMATLMWISYSERPLKVDELCHALAVEIGSPNLNTDNVPSIGTLLTCCQGLVVVDKKASTVRLIHFTLQEYFRVHPELFGAAHSAIAETCLSYLNSKQVMAFSTSPPHDLQSTPFLEYSSVYWGIHAKRDLSDCAKQLALKLFDDYNNHLSAKVLLKAQISGAYSRDFNYPSRFSGLHSACFFGIAEIVARLVESEGCDINQTDYRGNTPLLWAAWNGHEGAVKILLGRDDINPNPLDLDGRTPLCLSVESGHEGVVKILLERDDVRPWRLDMFGRTALGYAAESGREGVVEILLGRDDVNPNTLDSDGRTPLCLAAGNGHEGVVEVLLTRDDVNADKPDGFGRTPLSRASENGHEGTVKILLGRGDVNPDKPDMFGQTPLSLTAGNGHEGVVKILLGRDDVSPDRPDDEEGRTPLWCAAWGGHEGVVEILLGLDGVNPDKPDVSARTPFSCAASNGHEGVVRMLLERDDINPDRPDEEGRTPLWGAAGGGHEGVVEILLGHGDVDPNKQDMFGQTPLYCAASKGYAGVVGILLERDDISPDEPDISGETPLLCAGRRGHEKVVETILGQY